jgi:hypothetical protein
MSFYFVLVLHFCYKFYFVWNTLWICTIIFTEYCWLIKYILDRQETYRSKTVVLKPSVSAEALQGHINEEDLLSIVI